MSTEREATDNGETVYVGVRMPEDLKKRVRGAAGLRDMDMSEYIRQVLDESTEDLK